MSEIIKSTFNTVEAMSKEEIFDLCYNLQRYHGIFNQFINAGTPVFDTSLPTAAVYAERKTGNYLYMRINPFFWKSLTKPQQLFIIAHECLHLILNHLIRFGNYEDQDAVGKAIDIVVNHMCVEKLGMRRDEIDPTNQWCWIDNVLQNVPDVKNGETVDYYYQLICEDKEKNPQSGGGSVMDQHIPLSEEAVKEFIEQMDKVLSDGDKEFLQSIAAGDKDASQWKIIKIKVQKKKKWETVIKKWAIETAGHRERPKDQWVKIHRRIALIKSNMFMPSEMEVDDPLKAKKKIKVYFFLDTSGSCHHLAERFFAAAKSLPTDRFDIRLFCFHTAVEEVDIKQDGVKMGGGTAFDIIENHIQKLVKSGEEYPKAVFIVTDGDGNNVYPEYPKLWHWFLTVKHTQNIPKDCNIYNLNDYE